MATQDDDCRRAAKEARDSRIAEIANRGGEAAYNTFKTAYNGFIDVLQAQAATVSNVLEPLFMLDKQIFDIFVRPQLNTVIAAGKNVQQTIKLPAQVIGAMSNKCKGSRDNALAIGMFEKFNTLSLNEYQNKLDRFEYQAKIHQKTLDALQGLPGYVEELRIKKTYAQLTE